MKLTGENRSTRGKTCPSTTLSTTNPTWTDQGSDSGLRGERPANDRLNHGTANTLSLPKVTTKSLCKTGSNSYITSLATPPPPQLR
jgi:hypothetical protein